MTDNGSPDGSLHRRIIDELREFSVIAAYLCVCFTALAYLKAAILEAHGIAFAPFGFAAAKALICAKFMSLGHMFHLGSRFKGQALIWPTMHKSFAFLVLLVVLNASEEIIVGLLHGRPIVKSLADVEGGTLHQFIATTMIGLLILIPFFALRELTDLIGGHTMFRLFFEPRRTVVRKPEAAI
jgi:hypothetical protein